MKRIIGLTSAFLLMLPVGSMTALADSTESVETTTETPAPAMMVSYEEPTEGEIIEAEPEETATKEITATESSSEEIVGDTPGTEMAESTVEEEETFTAEEIESTPEETEEVKSEETPTEQITLETEAVTEATASSTDEEAPLIATTDATSYALTGNPYTGNFIGWTSESENAVKTSSFIRDGSTYTVESKINNENQFFATVVTDDTGATHTYSFDNGSGENSKLYLSIDGGSTYVTGTLSATNFYSQTDTFGTSIAKEGTITNSAGLELGFVEVMKMTNGVFQHYFTITNTGSTTYTSLQIVSMLDTELNGNDNNPIIANGKGGTYIQNGSLTLYNQALGNTQQKVGISGNLASMINTNKTAGNTLINGVNTAIYYLTNASGLSPGNSIEYAFEEGFYTNGEKIRTYIEFYIDEDGNELHAPITSHTMGYHQYHSTFLDFPNYIRVLLSYKIVSHDPIIEHNTYTYRYVKPETPETPKDTTNTDKTTDEKATSMGTKQQTTTQKAANSQPTTAPKTQQIAADALPATGEAESILAYITGISMIIFSGLVFWKRNKAAK